MIKLNKREIEILSLVSQGNSYKLIARKIELSLPTIKSYVRSAKTKLAANNVAQAAAMFVRHYIL